MREKNGEKVQELELKPSCFKESGVKSEREAKATWVTVPRYTLIDR